MIRIPAAHLGKVPESLLNLDLSNMLLKDGVPKAINIHVSSRDITNIGIDVSVDYKSSLVKVDCCPEFTYVADISIRGAENI